jgi:hypothetical protein
VLPLLPVVAIAAVVLVGDSCLAAASISLSQLLLQWL